MCVGGGAPLASRTPSYAKSARRSIKSIADFGLVREKLANMATLIYAGESLVYRTVGMMDAALGRSRQVRARRIARKSAKPSKNTRSSAPSSRSGDRR
jgi:alkylation response protein AidB-like acyl-CoA dehydrogenase